MNLPNITLFLQMLHFAIAYCILRKFVFAPALTILEQDEIHKTNLNQKVDNVRNQYRLLLEEKHQKWLDIQVSLRKMIPSLTKNICNKFMFTTTPLEVQKINITSYQKKELHLMIKKELLDV